MVIKLSNKGAAKKYFESINFSSDDSLKVYKNAKLSVAVKHICVTNDIYDAVGITPFEFASNLQNSEEFEKYLNLSKFLFLLSDEMPFTLAFVTIKNGEEKIEDSHKIIYGHKIMFIFHDLIDFNLKLIKHQMLKQIDKKQNAKMLPNSCIETNKKLFKVQCKMLVDFEKCYTGNLKKLLKMIKQINKKQEPIKLNENSTKFFVHVTDMSDEDFDSAIKLITLSSNIYETIEFKFLGGDKLIKNECGNQLFYYKTNFESFIDDVKTVLEMIISGYANFEPASNIAKFLPGVYQSCFYLFTNLLENINLVKEIEKCPEILGQFFKVNKIILELIWFSKQWFYLWESDSRIANKALNDYDPSKFTILINSETAEKIDFLYDTDDSNILWMFDANSTNDCEPKIISENKKYLFGITTPKNSYSRNTETQTVKSGILTYEIFGDNIPRFWLCSKCKCLLQTVYRNPLTVKCKCALNYFEKLEKFDIFDAKNSMSQFVISQSVAETSVTLNVEMKLSPQNGEISVDVFNNPHFFVTIG